MGCELGGVAERAVISLKRWSASVTGWIRNIFAFGGLLRWIAMSCVTDYERICLVICFANISSHQVPVFCFT